MQAMPDRRLLLVLHQVFPRDSAEHAHAEPIRKRSAKPRRRKTTTTRVRLARLYGIAIRPQRFTRSARERRSAFSCQFHTKSLF